MEQSVNRITLCGVLAAAPILSHESHGKRFYRFPLDVERLSGAVDTLQVLASEALMEQCDPFRGARILVTGQIRSFNCRVGTKRRLLISVFAETLETCDMEAANEVQLLGVLCREPVFRRTPLGREICDIMLAVNRPYNKADYLPCILWGRTAEELSDMPVGTPISICGRLQSRVYMKQLETGREERVAYEISALTAEIPQDF